MTQVRVSVVAGAEAWYKNTLIVSAAPCNKFAFPGSFVTCVEKVPVVQLN